eukprot:INCI16613.1.p1 GENE.INCI16613.1~~INCI16613.1.p1  ORF type:complete len:346 (-),score=45.32 INCI16613.1:981-2018(-)
MRQRHRTGSQQKALSRQSSADHLAALERGSPRRKSAPRPRARSASVTVAEGVAGSADTPMPQRKSVGTPATISAESVEVPGTFYAFSSQSQRPARRNALIVLFSVGMIFFAAFAVSKIPFIAARVAQGLPFEFSSNLAAVGLGTGVEVTTSWTFVIPHILVAAALEILLALIMLRRVRMSNPLVRRGVFALTIIHCVLIAPNWRGLPGPAGNIVFISICVLAALQLQFVDGKSQLGFSWLVLAVNSGPVGEVGFWLMKLRERLLEWREATEAVPAPSPGGVALGVEVASSAPAPSMAYGLLLALGILGCALVVLMFFVVAIYNVWFFTAKHGALPRSLFAWTRGT